MENPRLLVVDDESRGSTSRWRAHSSRVLEEAGGNNKAAATKLGAAGPSTAAWPTSG